MSESPFPMLPVAEALETVLAHATATIPKEVPLSEAVDHILANDIVASEPLPPFPASVKDGYAVVAADGPGVYPVRGEITAGREANFAIAAGTVAYITTGAPMPSGADAVVMVEDTNPVESVNGTPSVEIRAKVSVGDDVRPVGVDVTAGDKVLTKGERLDPAEIGLLATVGVTSVPIYRRPRVALLSTGDELVEPHEAIGPAQIRDSNRSMLLAATQTAGGTALDLGIGRDVEADLRSRIEQGLSEADILITSGGVSMGNLDLLKALLADAGEIHFGRILMKPGKPLTFATAHVHGRKRLIFGLPGNPVSSLVTFYLFVVPAIRKLAGWSRPELARIQATLAQPLKLDPVRPEYHRATLTWEDSLNDGHGGYLATSTGAQASSRLLSMRTANALLELPNREGMLAESSVVSALLLS